MGNENLDLKMGDLVEMKFYHWREFAMVATPPIKPGNPLIRIPGLMAVLVLACDDPIGVWRIGTLGHSRLSDVMRKLASVDDVLKNRMIEKFKEQFNRIDLPRFREYAQQEAQKNTRPEIVINFQHD